MRIRSEAPENKAILKFSTLKLISVPSLFDYLNLFSTNSKQLDACHHLVMLFMKLFKCFQVNSLTFKTYTIKHFWFPCHPEYLSLVWLGDTKFVLLSCMVAEVGILWASAKMAIQKFATKALFLHVIAWWKNACRRCLIQNKAGEDRKCWTRSRWCISEPGIKQITERGQACLWQGAGTCQTHVTHGGPNWPLFLMKKRHLTHGGPQLTF